MSEPANPEVVILNAALELPAERRIAYLDQACAGDANLRQQVEALLQAHEQAEGFLSAPSGRFDFKRTMLLNVLPTEKPGDKIGHYKLLQQIGEGGCGVVYMAEQEEPVRRRVALKIIKLGMDTKEVIARFEAERQALALMDHPNIAKVLDAGATRTGRPYFVMELVRGIKITDYCDENKISTEERLKLFIQVCQAIQHAHQKGIIHRDIKPSNILVTVNDGVPVPKVIDFGIAKATQGRLTDKTLFTAFEQFIGTPAYMSPEQAVMTSLDIDTRSDIYSLGVLLYELLTGKTPFDANELLQSGLDAMRRTIREKEPQKPSTRLSTMLDTERTAAATHRQTEPPRLIHLVRGDLDWIVMKSLEKDRSRRYETANGFAADIQRHLNNEPVNAYPPSGFYRLQKAVRRNKGVFTATAAIVVVLLIGVVASTSEAIRATRAEREQIRLRQVAESKQRKSEQVSQFLKDMLQSVKPSVALGRDTMILREVLDNTATRVGEDLHDQPEIEAELRSTLGTTYAAIGKDLESETMHREALAIYKKLYGSENLFVASALYSLSEELSLTGNQDEAKILQREALAIRRKLLGEEHFEVAHSLDLLSVILLRQSHELSGLLRNRKLDEAEKAERETLAMYRRLGGDPFNLTKPLACLGMIFQEQGKLEEAEAAIREALAIQKRMLRPDELALADTSVSLADVLMHHGKYTESEALYREAVTMIRKSCGNEHPWLAFVLGHLSELLHREGRLAESEAMLREVVAIGRKVHSNGQPQYIHMAGNLAILGELLRDQGKLTEAEALFREGISVGKSAGNQGPALTRSINGLADVLIREGKLVEAARLFDDQLINAAGNNPETAKVLNSRGGLRARAGHWKEAIPDFTKAVELETNNSAYYVGLASLLGITGDLDGYRNLCQRYLVVSGNTQDPTTAYWIARLCVVVPCPGVDMQIVSRLADLALVSQGTNGHYLSGEQFLKAVVEYRLGHYASAADYAGKSASGKMDDSDDIYHMGDYAIVAMSDYQLKQSSEAKAALAKTDELALTKVPRLEGGDLGGYWRVWVLAEGLHREAKILIENLSDAAEVKPQPK